MRIVYILLFRIMMKFLTGSKPFQQLSEAVENREKWFQGHIFATGRNPVFYLEASTKSRDSVEYSKIYKFKCLHK